MSTEKTAIARLILDDISEARRMLANAKALLNALRSNAARNETIRATLEEIAIYKEQIRFFRTELVTVNSL